MFNLFADLSGARNRVKPLVLGDQYSKAGKRKTICLVSDSRHTQVPTAHQLAEWLSRDGWQVTLLDLTPFESMEGESAAPAQAQAKKLYTYAKLKGNFDERNWFTPMQSLCAYHWLRQRKFDVIAFQYGFGAGYFSCVARAFGLAFASTPIVVFGDFPHTKWLDDNKYVPQIMLTDSKTRHVPPNVRTDSEIDFLERETVSRADALLLTDKKTLAWMAETGWQLPPKSGQVALLGEGRGRAWGKWLAALAPAKQTAPVRTAKVFISICILAEHASPLRALIGLLAKQSQPDFEVIVIEQSDSPAIKALRRDTAALFKKRAWQWAPAKKTSRAAALNKAARMAKGTHVLFLDDDDVPSADMVEIFARCAQRNIAPIISSMTGWHVFNDNSLIATAKFPGRGRKKGDSCMVAWVPYGACLTPNLWVNVLGEATLYRRDLFLSAGGFDPANDLFLTWGFLTRAALQQQRIEVLPEVLISFARNKQRYNLHDDIIDRSHLSVLRDVCANIHPTLRMALLGLIGVHLNHKKINPGLIQDANNLPAKKVAALPRVFRARFDDSVPQVALCASDAFVRPLGVTLASILSCTPKVDVHILCTFSDSSTAKIRALAKHFGREVNIVPVRPDMIAKLPAANLWGLGESTATYWRMFLPEYLPRLRKVIYMDSDVLVRRDLAELWQTDLAGNVLGAVQESSFPIGGGIYETLKGAFDGDYFNAGVLLIDLKQWKKEKIAQKVLEWSKRLEQQNNIFKFGDQSPLNLALQGKWRVLSPIWNFSQWNDKKLSPEGQKYVKLDKQQYQAFYKEPGIIHYLGPYKPWNEEGMRMNPFCNEYRATMRLVDALFGFGKAA